MLPEGRRIGPRRAMAATPTSTTPRPAADPAANRQAIESVARALGAVSVDDLLRFPLFVQIETVATCNARCVMCPVEEWRRDRLLMDDALFARIVGQLAPRADHIRAVTIQLDGEPLIDTRLETRIRRLKEIGIRSVVFSTNGSLMTAKRARSVLDSGVDEVTFSIDGADKDTFEGIRRRLDFDAVVANARGFVALRDRLRAPCRVRVRMAVSERNAHQFPALRAFWTAVLGPGDAVYGKLVHNWGSWQRDYRLPNPLPRDALNASPCQSPWTSLIILTDGRVPLCCADFNARAALGDANTQTIEEIWRGHTARLIRAGHLERGRNSLEMCVDCNMWDPSTQVA